MSHCFCVKYRKKLLSKTISQTIKDAILASQTSDFKIQVMEVDKDHIHLLVDYSPNVSVSQMVRLLKQTTTAKVWFSHSIELREHFWKNTYSGHLDILFVLQEMLRLKQ